MKQENFDCIGLLGPAGSGKDEVADFFCRKGFVKVAFADPMKRFAKNCFSLTYEHLWGPSSKRNEVFKVDVSWWMNALGRINNASEELVSHVLQAGMRIEGYQALLDWFTNIRRNYPDEISTRIILQTLGTEWGRTVDKDMWVRYGHETVDRIKKGHAYSQYDGLLVESPAPFGVIIPDHRFVNEVAETHNHDGYVLRLRRLALEPKAVGIEGHASEAEQASILDSIFDLVLEFEEGLDKMYAKLENVWEKKAWRHGHTNS